jgi:hypothetical protein
MFLMSIPRSSTRTGTSVPPLLTAQSGGQSASRGRPVYDKRRNRFSCLYFLWQSLSTVWSGWVLKTLGLISAECIPTVSCIPYLNAGYEFLSGSTPRLRYLLG